MNEDMTCFGCWPPERRAEFRRDVLQCAETVVRTDPEQAFGQYSTLIDIALQDPDLFTREEIDAAIASGFAWHREHHPNASLSPLAERFRARVEEWHADAQKGIAAGKATVRQAYRYLEGRIAALNEESGSG